MKRILILTLFCFFAYSSIAQTIVWKQVASLPEGYYCGEAVSLNNEIYNISLDKWIRKNDLPLLLSKPSAIVVNDEIIILGGQTLIDGKDDCSKKVLIYKPKSDQWIETIPLPAKNVFFGCTSIDNKIYVIGGTVGGNPNWESYTSVYEGEIINK